MKKLITGLGIILLSISALAGCIATEEVVETEEVDTEEITEEAVETEEIAEEINTEEVSSEEVATYVAKPGTFAYDSEKYIYHGDFDALGYVTTQTMSEGFCTENCKTYTYAFFNILETPNESVAKYTEENTGNAFVGNMSIGIGCVTDEIVWRMSGSDELGIEKQTNSLASSEKLLNSTEKEPITVNLKREIFTAGAGAPDCYAHFSKVEVVN